MTWLIILTVIAIPFGAVACLCAMAGIADRGIEKMVKGDRNGNRD